MIILFSNQQKYDAIWQTEMAVTGISEKILIQELNLLVENKLVSKKVFI